MRRLLSCIHCTARQLPRLLQVPGICQGERLVIRDEGLSPWAGLGHTDFALHSASVPFEKCHVVSQCRKLRTIQLSRSAHGDDILGLIHTFQRNLIAGENGIREC